MWRTRGHPAAVELLKSSLARGHVSHAYLISGPRRIGKTTLALELAMALNCTTWQGEGQASLFGQTSAGTGDPEPCYECASCRKVLAGAHPDTTIVEEWTTERAAIIDQVRNIQYAASLQPYEGRWKVYGLLNAEQLTVPAQNALLKTLEEPTPTVCIILTAPSPQMLLPTVVSRCQHVTLHPPSPADVADALVELRGVEPERAKFLAGLAGGRMGWAMEAAENPALLEARADAFQRLLAVLQGDLVERFRIAEGLAAQAASQPDEVDEMLQLWLTWLRDVLLIVEGCEDLVMNLDQLEALRSTAKRMTSREAQAAVRGLQAARSQVAGSINTRLALEVLMLHLPATGIPAIR